MNFAPGAVFPRETIHFVAKVACLAGFLAVASCGRSADTMADDCLWMHLPPDTRAALFASYDAQGSEGLGSVNIGDAEIRRLQGVCAPTHAVPSTAQLHATGIVLAGLALQESAARHLTQAEDVPEARLLAAWRAVPEDERQLVLDAIRSANRGGTPKTDIARVLRKAAGLAGWRADRHGVDPPEVSLRHYLNYFQGLAQSEAFKRQL
jgi:hypothetical protein